MFVCFVPMFKLSFFFGIQVCLFTRAYLCFIVCAYIQTYSTRYTIVFLIFVSIPFNRVTEFVKIKRTGFIKSSYRTLLVMPLTE